MRVLAIGVEYALDLRFSAVMIPIRANIVAPPSVAKDQGFPWQSAIKKMKAQRSVIQPQPNNWDCELIEF
jgi:hypothetical protein